jgi:putative transposase
MPLGLKRFHHSGQSHFITFSCYRRRPYLADPHLRDLFLDSLEFIRQKYGVSVFGYVVMPEHVHLLISEPESGELSKVIQALKVSAAMKWRSFADSQSPALWQKRYYDHNVRSHASFVNKLRYIHRNPVKRGLCPRPEDWSWSSFCHYLSAERGAVEIESQWTARSRDGKHPHLLGADVGHHQK